MTTSSKHPETLALHGGSYRKDPTTKIIPEPSEKVIYQPNEDKTNEIEENLNNEKDIVIEVQDFTGIEDYIQKDISSVLLEYGSFNFSKKEEIYELHRYNADKCRIFIQNNTLNKKVVTITIFHIENKKFLTSYEKNLCL